MSHHQGREGRIVGGRRLIHPSHGLKRIVVKAHHHVTRETGGYGAFVVCAQRQTDCMQPEISPATLVGDRKAIAPNPYFAPANDGKPDTARSDDDNASISSAMRPDAGDCGVIDVNDRTEGMLPLRQSLERSFAADSGKPDGGVHRAQHVGVEPSFLDGCVTSLFHLDKRTVDP